MSCAACCVGTWPAALGPPDGADHRGVVRRRRALGSFATRSRLYLALRKRHQLPMAGDRRGGPFRQGFSRIGRPACIWCSNRLLCSGEPNPSETQECLPAPFRQSPRWPPCMSSQTIWNSTTSSGESRPSSATQPWQQVKDSMASNDGARAGWLLLPLLLDIALAAAPCAIAKSPRASRPGAAAKEHRDCEGLGFTPGGGPHAAPRSRPCLGAAGPRSG